MTDTAIKDQIRYHNERIGELLCLLSSEPKKKKTVIVNDYYEKAKQKLLKKQLCKH